MPALAYRTRMPKPNDPDIIRRFADATRKGHPVATAATLAGISRVAYEWLERGNAQLDAGDELGSHAAFAEAHKQATADFVDSKLDQIHDAAASGPKFWPAAMTLIERRFPRDFGRNDRLEVESRVVNINIDAQLGPGQRAALLAQLQEEQALIEAPHGDADTPSA